MSTYLITIIRPSLISTAYHAVHQIDKSRAKSYLSRSSSVIAYNAIAKSYPMDSLLLVKRPLKALSYQIVHSYKLYLEQRSRILCSEEKYTTVSRTLHRRTMTLDSLGKHVYLAFTTLPLFDLQVSLNLC